MAVHPRYKVRENSFQHYDSYDGRIQSGPINRRLVLPYQRVIYTSSGNGGCQGSAALSNIEHVRADRRPYAQARDRFFHAARDRSQAALGITFLEFNKSLDMLTSRAGSLFSSLNQLRRGNLYGALRALNVDKKKSRQTRLSPRATAGSLSNQWLEINFGWLPLIQDIYAAIEVLQSNQPISRVSGSGRGTYELERVLVDLPNYETWKINMLGTKSERVVGDVRVTNPNLFLANKLGLTNPAAIVWDTVPFSFVVDWFLPVNKFLNSFDDSLGLGIENVSHSVTIRTMGDERYSNWMGRSELTVSQATEFYRYDSNLPFPSFKDRLKPLDGSLWRAVTSVALVSQLLNRSR